MELRLALIGRGLLPASADDARETLTTIGHGVEPHDALHAKVVLAAMDYARSSQLENAPARDFTLRPTVVLLAFANDRSEGGRRLNLPAERRAIERALKDNVQVEVVHDALVDEVWEAFREQSMIGRVQVFHFAGHASADWLAFEDEAGASMNASVEGLSGFFGRQEELVLVFLNGCSTLAQVERLRPKVRAIVATSEAIDDKVAAELAGHFYTGLRTQPLERAYLDAVDLMIAKRGSDPRGVLKRRELAVSGPGESEWPWTLVCDEACKSWRLGDPPPSRNVGEA